MLCLIFIISQRFIAYKPDDASSQNHLIIDFGGRFIKGGLTGSQSKTISFLYKNANCLKKVSNDCYSIPNSISGSAEYMLGSENPEVMIRVGEKGYDWAVKSKNDAYQYFGAFYNLKYSYLKKIIICSIFQKMLIYHNIPIFGISNKYLKFTKMKQKLNK